MQASLDAARRAGNTTLIAQYEAKLAEMDRRDAGEGGQPKRLDTLRASRTRVSGAAGMTAAEAGLPDRDVLAWHGVPSHLVGKAATAGSAQDDRSDDERLSDATQAISAIHKAARP